MRRHSIFQNQISRNREALSSFMDETGTAAEFPRDSPYLLAKQNAKYHPHFRIHKLQ